jgi:thymidine phosphorylase
MTLRDLIERKRDGGHIPSAEWHAFARDLAAGALPDYQVAALLMAIYFRGLSDDETLALMEGMLESGQTLDLRHLAIGCVDKHSTGGVGDKLRCGSADDFGEGAGTHWRHARQTRNDSWFQHTALA